jgi:alkylation response protein AidB-like acyl-CoA dehydrogenase
MPKASEKELKLLEKAATEFARKELVPNREENDKYPFGPFFDSVLDKAYELDFFHIVLPEEADGMGHGIRALCIVLDCICQADSSLGGIIFTTAAAQEVLLAAGENDVLKRIASNAKKAADFLIAFPVFNNPNEIRPATSAVKKNGEYYLSGSLEYAVLGDLAAQALIPSKTDRQEGYTYFLINLSEPGVQKSNPVHSLGLHACPAVDLVLNDVPAELIGKPGEGKQYFEKMADRLNIAAAAMSAGTMKGSFKEAFEYSKMRSQGGKKIIHWSEIKMILANMAVQIKIADLCVTGASQDVDSQSPGWAAGSRASAIHVQSAACDLTTDGIQVLGGVGYMKDFGQEKRFRDAKHLQALLGIAPLKKINYINTMIR